MNLNEYQMQAASTADYPAHTPTEGLPPGLYTALGLNGEAGEVAEKIKKYWRDRNDYEVTQEGVKKELGDVLWYLSETARQWGLKLDDVAQANLDKLADRTKRGVLHGAGDNR